jgi:hypothetical protein
MLTDNSKPLISRDFEGLPKKRQCTDCLFIPVFVLYWVGMIWVGFSAFKTQRYERITRGFDYLGNTCGVGTCAGHPYRFTPYIEQPFFALCVNECPGVLADVAALTSCGNVPAETLDPLLLSVSANAGTTALKLRSFCVPTSFGDRLSDIPGQGEFTRVVEALGDAWRVLLLSVFIAMFGALLFICLVRYCGGTIMLTLAVGVIACFGGTGYLLTTKAEEYKNEDDKDVKNSMLAFGYASYACAAVCILIICCLYKELLMAVRVIKEGMISHHIWRRIV